MALPGARSALPDRPRSVGDLVQEHVGTGLKPGCLAFPEWLQADPSTLWMTPRTGQLLG